MKTKVTFALTALCVAVYVLEFAYPDAILGFFSLESSQMLLKPWSLLTYMFIHADNAHIFYNMFGLLIFGMVLESIIGSKRFAMIFFASGIASGIAGMVFYSTMIGASGAVFGIIGCLAVLRPKMQVWIFFISAPMAIAAIIYVFYDMIGIFVPDGIAHIAHLAGIGIGIVYGIVLRTAYHEAKPQKHASPLSETELEEWEDENMGDDKEENDGK